MKRTHLSKRAKERVFATTLLFWLFPLRHKIDDKKKWQGLSLKTSLICTNVSTSEVVSKKKVRTSQVAISRVIGNREITAKMSFSILLSQQVFSSVGRGDNIEIISKMESTHKTSPENKVSAYGVLVPLQKRRSRQFRAQNSKNRITGSRSEFFCTHSLTRWEQETTLNLVTHDNQSL